ncbi:MAG: hypothetical protein KKA84_16495 [Bacteroidetes bacterium]|nr:hypothetical protein [Bacteroidota bacterium]
MLEELIKKEDYKFLSLPLSSLTYTGTYRDMVSDMIDYGITTFAFSKDWGEFKNDDEEILAETVYSAYQKVFELKKYSGSQLLKGYNRMKSIVDPFEEKYKKDAYFRVPIGLIMDAYNGNFPERKLRVYCAIRSILGCKNKFLRISYDRIRRCMLGYKNEISFNEAGHVALSDRQIGYTVRQLMEAGLLSSYTYRRRVKYYSTVYKNPEEIAEALAIRLKKKKGRVLTSEESDSIIEKYLSEV